jgi:hypothetical protein
MTERMKAMSLLLVVLVLGILIGYQVGYRECGRVEA